MPRLGNFVIWGLLLGSAVSADTLPTPIGLHPCTSDDLIAKAEAGLAAKLGAEYLGCFKSKRPPVEYAIAIGLRDKDYKMADLDNMDDMTIVRMDLSGGEAGKIVGLAMCIEKAGLNYSGIFIDDP